MAVRSSEAWWHQHWGAPCDLHDPAVVLIGGHGFRTDGRMVAAWQAWERVRARHGYEVRPPYPAGDSGMYNCRRIGSDPSRPWSVHSWAGALDVNWGTNPDGSRLVTDMPQEMRDELHALRTRSGAPVFRWGGDWDRDQRTGHSYYDAMHWEIVATPAELASGIIDPNDEEDDMTPEEHRMLVEVHAELRSLRASNDGHARTLLAAVNAVPTKVRASIYTARDSVSELFRRALGIKTVDDQATQHTLDAETGKTFQASIRKG